MLEDRSYMREESHRFMWRNGSVMLMLVLVVCFALQQIAYFYTGFDVDRYLALSAAGLKKGFVWQLITFQFLHGGLFHLICNLIGIFFFGRFVEARLGTKAFLTLYFLSGIGGGMLQGLLGILLPQYFAFGAVVGASAGVLGLLAAFALIEPEASILLWFVLPIKAKYILWASGAIALFFTIVPTSPGVAHAAHLGGLLVGVAYMRWDAQRAALNWNPLEARRRKRQLVQTAAQVAKWRPRRSETSRNPEMPPEEFISREVDPILDKISAHGIHSLTPREREILEAARTRMSKR